MLKRLSFILLTCFFFFKILSLESCIKEYSYERQPVDTLDTIPQTDTLNNDTIPADTIAKPLIIPNCNLCELQNDSATDTWSFKYETSFSCGNVTNAVLDVVEKTKFTFFGPSLCSPDTGLIITVLLSKPLMHDTTNFTAEKVEFQYYNKGTQNIFDSFDSAPFSLVIEQYTQSTGIAIGRFSGYVNTDRNTTAEIKEGKFFIQF